MNEIYWLTRLGGLHTFFSTCLGVSVAACVIAGAFYFAAKVVGVDYDDEYDGLPRPTTLVKLFCGGLIGCFLFGLATIFTPTTKEAFAIWGVGGTIDYIKSNETAKGLPDKTIKALDKWLDSLSEEEDEQP